MNKSLISLMFVLLFMMGSCGGDDAPCLESNKFCHSHGGLSWSDASNNSMNWSDAIQYCKNLGGRLPKISELRKLIQNCSATITGGECGITTDCLSFKDCWNNSCAECSEKYGGSGKYSVFGDNYWFWSSSEESENTDVIWCVDFSYGDIVRSGYENPDPYVRCVR
mgnify:FL=1